MVSFQSMMLLNSSIVSYRIIVCCFSEVVRRISVPVRAVLFTVGPMNVCWWKGQAWIWRLVQTDLFPLISITLTSHFHMVTTLRPALMR